MDAIVIGGGVMGAACALYLSNAGAKVLVLDQTEMTSSVTGAGRGDVRVSDHESGPELDLARRSRDAWFEISGDIGGGFELESRGRLVISRDDSSVAKLRDTAKKQRANNIEAIELGTHELFELEPHLARDISFGIYYPQDAQCHPALAAAKMLQSARKTGGAIRANEKVLTISGKKGKLSVQTSGGHYTAPTVVNATEINAGIIAHLAGSSLPIESFCDYVLVTAPAPSLVQGEVCETRVVVQAPRENMAPQINVVVSRTHSGAILIGADGEKTGFNSNLDVLIWKLLASRAVSLFPLLSKTDLLRIDRNLRSYVPDHRPVIGEDPFIPGLFHATGHEGSGVGLAPATAELIRAVITRQPGFMDPKPFSPHRFVGTS